MRSPTTKIAGGVAVAALLGAGGCFITSEPEYGTLGLPGGDLSDGDKTHGGTRSPDAGSISGGGGDPPPDPDYDDDVPAVPGEGPDDGNGQGSEWEPGAGGFTIDDLDEDGLSCDALAGAPLEPGDCAAPLDAVQACHVEARWELGGEHYQGWLYDAAGRRTAHDWEHGGSGPAGERWRFDADDRVLVWERLAGGCVQQRVRSLRTEDGRLVAERHDRLGKAPLCTLIAYDGAGREWARFADEECDCVGAKLSLRLSRDAAGNVISREAFSQNGQRSAVTRYRYDAAGNRTRVEDDFDADGTPDHVEETEYDELGRPRTQDERWQDPEACEGACEQHREWDYEDARRRVTYRFDEDADGRDDSVRRESFDSRGRLIRLERDENGDGRFEDVWETRYSEAERSETVTQIHNGATVAEARDSYDSDGRLVQRDATRGEERRIVEYAYQGDGQLATIAERVLGWEPRRCRVRYAYEGDVCPATAPPRRGVASGQSDPHRAPPVLAGACLDDD